MIQKNPNYIQIGGRSRSRNSKPRLSLLSTNQNMFPPRQHSVCSKNSSKRNSIEGKNQINLSNRIDQKMTRNINRCELKMPMNKIINEQNRTIHIQQIEQKISERAISQQVSSISHNNISRIELVDTSFYPPERYTQRKEFSRNNVEEKITEKLQNKLLRQIKCLQNRVGQLHKQNIQNILNSNQYIQKLTQEINSFKIISSSQQNQVQENSFYVMQPNPNLVIEIISQKCEQLKKELEKVQDQCKNYKQKYQKQNIQKTKITKQLLENKQSLQKHLIKIKQLQEFTKQQCLFCREEQKKRRQMQSQIKQYKKEMQVLKNQHFQLEQTTSQQMTTAMQEIRSLKQIIAQKQMSLNFHLSEQKGQSVYSNFPLQYSNDVFSKIEEQCSQQYQFQNQSLNHNLIVKLEQQNKNLKTINCENKQKITQKDKKVFQLQSKIHQLELQNKKQKPKECFKNCERCGELLKTIFRLNQVLNNKGI